MLTDKKIRESRKDEKTVKCTVKSVHKEGVAVSVELNGETVNGVISPRCYGVGEERMRSLAAIRPGDMIEAIVRSHDTHTKSCSLVLPGFENLPPNPMKRKRLVGSVNYEANYGCLHRHMPKAVFTPDPPGTTYVFDFANVIGLIPLSCVPNAKASMETRFSESGYAALFYLDRRTAGWLSHALPSETAKDRFFRSFRATGNASFVGNNKNSIPNVRKHEADLAVLQTTSAIAGAVACSRDGYEDYAASFPTIVSDRVRQFSVVVLPNGSAVLTVEGAGCGAVIIPPFQETDMKPGNDVDKTALAS